MTQFALNLQINFNFNYMRLKIVFYCFLVFGIKLVSAQTIQIIQNLSTSNNSIIGQSLYHVSESIYTNTEIGEGNFTSNAINQIAFSFTQIGNPALVNSLKVWMKNVAVSNAVFSSGTYTNAGYTLVYNGSITPVSGSWNVISLQTNFLRTSNSNLQVLIERLDGAQHVANVGFTNGFVANTSNGNNNSVSAFSSRRFNGTSLPVATTSLTITPFRPAIKLIHQNQVDLSVRTVTYPVTSCFSSPQSISLTIANSGNGNMPSGTSNIHFRSGGSNINNINLNLTSSIGPGDSIQFDIPAVFMNNVGIRYDTFVVSNNLDQNPINDTLISTHQTSGIINHFPFEENIENATREFQYNQNVLGDRNLWLTQTGSYTNPDQIDNLQPRSTGNNFFLFDAYGGSNSNGFTSRIFGSCISIPPVNSAFPTRDVKLSFWMSHDPSAPFVYDSLYVVVTENKGQTWQRVKGFQRWDENLDLPEWRNDSVDLSNYVGKTIQVGFEGVSKYGNAFGLDDITFSVTPFCANPPNAIAGSAVQICNEQDYSLSIGNPSISGSADAGYWVTSGSGGFIGGSIYGSELQYQPSFTDKEMGSVTLSLITNNLDTENCLADTSDLVLTILPASFDTVQQVACDSVFWNGSTYFTSGFYPWIGTNSDGCDSTVTFNVTINNSSTFNDTVQTCTPYFWNGNTYSVSGTYSFSSTNSNGCDSLSILKLETIPCITTLNIHALLEGYYRGSNSLASLLYDLGNGISSTVSDSIQVLLWRNNGVQNFNYVFNAIIKTDGNINLILPDSLRGNLFYIGVKHRNHLETWSSNLVEIAYSTIYSFADDAAKALSDGVNLGMKYLGTNQFAYYAGDVNQDGTIDLFDLQQTENDASQFIFGYESSDINGDTFSDLFDLQTIENNSSLFIFTTRPF